MFGFKLSEKSANEVYDILVQHMGAKDISYWRGEFLDQFTNKEIAQEYWFTGVGGTGWKLWFDSFRRTFVIRHESGYTLPARQKNVQDANEALNAPWEFLAV